MLSCNGDHVVYDTKVLRKYIYEVVKIDFNLKDYKIGICCIKQKEQSLVGSVSE